jgi:hypothetical protein
MWARFDKEGIHKLFLEERGNIRAVMNHKGTPKSPNTIRRYAKDGRWHEELPENNRCKKVSVKKLGTKNNKPKKLSEEKNRVDVVDDGLKDIDGLEQIKEAIYKFLVLSSSEKNDNTELKPKTYAEAVKCYLDIDSRIEEKKGKSSDITSSPWEEIMRRVSSDK